MSLPKPYMRFCYADPSYLGQCARYGHPHQDGCWDEVATHAALIERLCSAFPDGWAMSLSSPSLKAILPLCPDDVLIGAWVKPFASFKPNVNPAYCWEPVIFRGGRKRDREAATARDFVAANITLEKGTVGAKPEAFALWVFDLLGAEDGDELVDMFVGSGAVSRVWRNRHRQAEMSL